MCKKRVFLVVVLAFGLAVGPVSADVTAGLVGHWPFDGDVTDASGNGNDGTINGNAALASDRFGTPDGAMFFSAESDAYVDVGDPQEFQISGAMTLAAWVFLNGANTNNGRIVAKQAGGGSRSWNLNIEAESGGVANPATFQISETGDTILGVVDTQPLPTDQWVHMAGVYRPGEAIEVYVDGQLHASNTAGIPTRQFSANSMPVLIGSRSACGNCGWDGSIDDVRIYNRALSPAEIQQVVRGSADLSTNPAPTDGATDVPRDAVLSWSPGESAATHDVYLGLAFDDVNDASRADALGVLVSQGQTEESFAPAGLLAFGQTYYWRVDEVNAAPDNTIFQGDIWSFTAEPLAYPVANVTASASGAQANAAPERTIDGSGLNDNDEHSIDAPDMWLTAGNGEPVWIQYEFDRLYKLHELWIWNYNVQFELVLGFGVKDVTIEYSEDGATWTSFGDVEFARGTATAAYAHNTTVDLDGVVAKYVRLNVNSGWGPAGQFGLSEVRFLYVPVQAREPEPSDGAAAVDPTAVLSWRAGRDAAAHDVYLGTDAEALDLAGTVSEATFVPGDLLFGRDYSWRVDEVNEADATPVWMGELWGFATQAFVSIEDFESYNDDDNPIYETWIDGWVNETGSTVGYLEAPFAERTIVHGGRQSMPLTYENAAAPFYSEAEYDVGGADWDRNGADTLQLFVYGQAPAFVESADGSISMNAIGADIWNNADECRYVYKQLTGDGSMTVRVDYLDATPSTWAKGGVMVRQSTEAGAINAFVAMTGGDGGGATFQQRLEADGSSVSQHTYEGNPFAPPYWVKLERAGSAVSAFISPDGQTWQQAGDTATVALTDPVLIGLALTSHNASVATSAAFSQLSTTGAVGGSWQIAEIGVEQPTGGNDPESLYVAIEDSAGNVAIVTHPDAAVRSGWTLWLIPYSELTGINLNSVRRMYIGLGDRDNPSAGGSGLVFIDDIGFGHPAVGQ